MVKIVFGIFFLTLSIHVKSQDRLEPERPGETKTPELVKGNHLQAEIGFRSEKVNDNEKLYQHPNATLRFGLFNAIELRMNANSQTIRNSVSKESDKGFEPLEFGVKAKILPEYKWSPSIALLGMIGVPSTASIDYYNKRLPIEFRTLFSNTVNNKLKIQYNVGVRWEGDDRREQWMYSFTPVYEIHEKLNLFIEEYAFLRNGTTARHYLDGGLEYFINNGFMVDLSGGTGLSEFSSSWFIAAGFSFRLPMK